MSINKVLVPNIGDIENVEIIDILIAKGDTIAKDDPILTVETDKAAMEIPSPTSGVVIELSVKVGDKISEGSELLLLDETTTTPDKPESESESEIIDPKPAEQASSNIIEPSTNTSNDITSGSVYASPSIRKMARTLGISLEQVTGTGKKDRVTQQDLEHFVKQNMDKTTNSSATNNFSNLDAPAFLSINHAQFGPVTEQPLSRIQKISGSHLHNVWLNVPMVTHHDEADITELESFRNSLKEESHKQGIKLTMLAFVIKAIGHAIKVFPRFNSSLAADNILILKQYYNVGIAMDTPKGLVVPVIKNVDTKSIYDISKEISATSTRATEGTLTTSDLQGGCISISSLGGIGGTAFTPIVNAPEVAILGITRSKIQPVWDGSEFTPKLMLPLDLTYDHRVIDGAEAARFVTYLCKCLADVRRLIL